MRPPNLFIVGAAKAGTTYLHWLLGTHPDICMSTVKEPHFFARAQINPSLPRPQTLEQYLRLFPGSAAASFVGEASPSYLFDSEAAARLAEFCPEAKIIITLRDPVARTYSHYLMDVRLGQETLSFRQALEEDSRLQPRFWGGPSHLYLDLSHYAPQVARYLSAFPREQLLILEMGDRQSDGRTTKSVLAEFLQVDPDAFAAAAASPQERNAHIVPRSRLARRILASARLRYMARGVLGSAVRARTRQALLTERYQPEIDETSMRQLRQSLLPQVEELRELAQAELPTLTAGWD